MQHSFTDILSSYDALIVDLWGVIHDGSTLYPGVADTLRLLHQMNKPVLFLSNAPRVAAKLDVGRYFMKRVLPQTVSLDAIVRSGSGVMMAMAEAAF